VNASEPIGALRVTLPTSFVDARIHRSWLILAGVGLVILVLVYFVSLRLARQVTKPVEELADAASKFGQGALDTRAPVPRGPPELQNLAESFNQTAARLEDLVASQQAFVADASHQLRTPLAALRLRLENLERDLDDHGQANEDVAGSLAEVARLSRLVDGLLELARAERGVAAAEPVDLAEVVDGRVDAWSALAGERGVALVASIPPVTVASGPGRLEQILDNVLANAIEVSPRDSTIRVTAGAHNGLVELRVVDEGPGMSDESRARAFDRFWRPVGGERSNGAGLGLAIVHSLVTADGGEVALEENEHGGLAVVMSLRAARR
jgi:signal transduction histidine kinase